MKKIKMVMVICSIVFFYALLPLAAAEIFLGQAADLYNFGDELIMNATLVEKLNTNGFFSVVLECPQGSVEIYKTSQNVEGGKQKSISFSSGFNKAIIGNLSGVCSLSASYSGEEKNSNSFEITSDVNVQANIDKSVYSPLDRVFITGSAYKRNGKPVQGFVESKLGESDTSVSGLVNNGIYNLSFTIPEHYMSKNYLVKTRAYETDYNGELTNEGSSMISIKVRQVPSNLNIALESLNVSPGNDLLFMVLLKDQAGEDMKIDISTVIKHPDSTIAEKRLVHTGESNIFNIDKNSTPGNWIVEAELNGLKFSKSWYVDEFENVSYSISNGTLSILNTGNVPYNKPIEITIGNVKEIKDINLSVGGIKQFKIYAPDGSYDLGISDGKSFSDLGKNYLTGNSISVKDIEGVANGLSSLAIWVVIGMLAVTALLYGRRVIKRRFYGVMPREISAKSDYPDKTSSPLKYRKSEFKGDVSAYVNRSGKKEECGVVFLDVRNSNEIQQDEQASSMIDRAVKIAKESNAFVKEDAEGFSFIFSSARTGEKDNSFYSVRVAKKIEQSFQDYNRRNALNIDFGIGVHFGEMIVEYMQGRHDFHAIGSTIITAKRAAEKSRGEVLLSGSAHRKTAVTVKTEMLNGENLWKVKNIVDREEHKEFLDRFMRKNY